MSNTGRDECCPANLDFVVFENFEQENKAKHDETRWLKWFGRITTIHSTTAYDRWFARHGVSILTSCICRITGSRMAVDANRVRLLDYNRWLHTNWISLTEWWLVWEWFSRTREWENALSLGRMAFGWISFELALSNQQFHIGYI